MTPFNNELQIGQPAMIINVEYEKNRHLVRTVVIIHDLLSPEQAELEVFEPKGQGYATYILESDSIECFIQQRYLMPLPPLGDVYDQEKMDEMENLKVYN